VIGGLSRVAMQAESNRLVTIEAPLPVCEAQTVHSFTSSEFVHKLRAWD